MRRAPDCRAGRPQPLCGDAAAEDRVCGGVGGADEALSCQRPECQRGSAEAARLGRLAAP